jgi:diguanylate cyclase (GGDEF)-like protein/PAS domain S-box-containing protein
LNRPEILLVDDRVENLIAFESLLEDFEVDLLQARSGEQALQLILKHDVSLVILDVQMPGMDGYEVASLMKQAPHSRTIPIIFVTAINRDLDQILKGYQSGAVDFLTKPVEPLIFRSKVQVFLDLDRKTRELAHFNAALESSLEEIERLKDYNELLLSSIGEGILSLDPEGRISYANPAALTLLRQDAEIVGGDFSVFLDDDNPAGLMDMLRERCLNERGWEGVIQLYRGNDSFPAEVTVTPFRDGKNRFDGISVVFEDITEREKREREIIQASERDPLTELTNRRGFDRVLSERLRRDRAHLALLFIDLDDFKPVNDNMGHQVGDRVLQVLARRFNAVTRDSDMVARLGGDEFCVLARLKDPDTEAAVVANKLLEACGRPLEANDSEITLSASVGIAIPSAGCTPGELVECADRAMYQAKRGGGARYRLLHCHP